MLGLSPELLLPQSLAGASADTSTLLVALRKAAGSLALNIPVETTLSSQSTATGAGGDDNEPPAFAPNSIGSPSEADFRSMYHQGKISAKDLADSRQRLGLSGSHELLLPGLTLSSLEHALLTRQDNRIEPALRDWVLGLPWHEVASGIREDSLTPGECSRRLHGPGLNQATRSVLIPRCTQFLDKGSPENPESFWRFFLGNVSLGGIKAPYGRALEADACKRLAEGQSSAEAALELLGLGNPSPQYLEEAIRLTLLQHPGWSGRFHQIESGTVVSDKAKHTVRLVDFLAALLLVEFHIARDGLIQSGLVTRSEVGSPGSLARFLRQGLRPIEKTPELQREPWELCLALMDLGFSGQIHPTLTTPEARVALTRATLAFGPWRRLAIWHGAFDNVKKRLEKIPRSATSPVASGNPVLPAAIISSNPADPASGSEKISAMRVLLIEDDPLIGKAVSRGLSDFGHSCTWTKNGQAGLEEFLTQRHDCVILDLMLPEVAGLDILRQARERGIRTPVVVPTALGAVEERVAGLRDGADDYLVKPFAFHELLARLEAVRRRASNRPAPSLTAGKIQLDLTNRRVTCSGKHIDLTPTGFTLLEILMRNAGSVVTRKMLCEHLWEGEWESATNIIEVHVNRLRNKLAQAGAEGLIQTVRGHGYTLKSV